MGILSHGTFTFAAGTCVCTTNDADCRAVFLSSTQQSTSGCKEACTKDIGKNLTLSEFADGTEGEILASTCGQKHSVFLTSKTASGTGTPSTPATPSATITPTLNVPIPGLTFSKATATSTSVKSSFLADYLTAVYQFLIYASITIAIVMVMVGGLQYAVAASGGDVSKGKTRIMNALTGLVLLLGVYLILYTTNPQLTLLKSIELQNVQTVEVPEHEGDVITDEEIASSGQSTSSVRVCSTVDSCKLLCAKGKGEWPSSNPKTIDPNLVSKAPNSPGFVNDGGSGSKGKVTKDVQDALKKAGEIAQSMDSSYTIHLISAFRPLERQIEMVCDVLATGNEKKIAGIGKAVAWPGGSNHGSGVAIDIMLKKGNVALTDPSFSTTNQQNPKYKDGAQLLSQIMTQAGFVRYAKEIWHFELKSKAGSYCRCSYPSCPFPAHC